MRKALSWAALPLSVFCFYQVADWGRWMHMIYRANGDSLWLVYCSLNWAYCIEIVVYAASGALLLWAFTANICAPEPDRDAHPPF
jgi:hypothetical protein